MPIEVVTTLLLATHLRRRPGETNHLIVRPEQLKMARAALGWSMSDLAQHAELGRATVARFELGEVVGQGSIEAMQVACERGGVEFISAGATVRASNGPAGAGVRLREVS